ncbi:MAG: signal peptidase II [Lentisphaeria bacterium]|nr:signal peptidase II [Lentisphaeria bacterium]
MKHFPLSKTALVGWPGLCALVIFLLDQFTKFLVYHNWPTPGENEIVLIPKVLKLVHWRNLGAAWGILAGRPWLLGLLSLAVALAIILYWKTISEKEPFYAIPCGILLGGILGNMIDRLFFPLGVVDFIRFEYWPAFNVADSAISCSVVFIIFYEFFRTKRAAGEKAKKG